MLLPLVAASAPAAQPKRVLVVHSFVNAAPPFTTHSLAFEAELAAKLGKQIDLDEVSLDVARYADLDMEQALVEFLRKRHAQWQPDLVVPIGSPAGVFLAQHRDRLFPKETPIIYTGMDRRRLPAGALEQNATFVGESFDFPKMLEDMLQLMPATTNIAVVIGASPLERFWKQVLVSEFQPFTNRAGLTWFNPLSFDQMLEQAGRLPPHSAIFFVLLMRDATGVTYNADEALRQMHEVANAPIFGIFKHQLALGTVGGRLYPAELEGVESARIAARVLQGEPLTNFPPLIIGPLGPQYHARELQRWNISEAQLPPGSQVLFREPTNWDRYKGRILATGALVCLQGIIISLLLANLRKRRRAERAAREISGRLITAQEDERRRIARDLHDDLNQRLAMLSVNADLLGRMNAESPSQELVAEIADRLKDISSEVHKLSHQLHPAKLDQLGLVSATRSLCNEVARQYGTTITFVHDDLPRDLHRDVALCFYRLVQEGLQNIIKHSEADEAHVALRHSGTELRLMVSDNGRGFDSESPAQKAGLGLTGMRERVRLVHGQIAFHSAPDQGTRIEASAPIVLSSAEDRVILPPTRHRSVT